MPRLQVVMPDDEPDDVVQARAEELRLLEAMLFASAEPLDEKSLAARLPQGIDVHEALVRLQEEYATRGVNLVRIGGKWTFRTANDLSWLLSKESIETRKLSRAAIETLAIIAYHQPVTRAEIEELRGVSTSKGSVDVLLETGWIRPRGRRKSPGRPLSYGRRSYRISGWTRWAICRGSRSSRGRACWMAGCRRGFPCRCRRTTRLCVRTRIRWNRATLISALRHHRSAPARNERRVGLIAAKGRRDPSA